MSQVRRVLVAACLLLGSTIATSAEAQPAPPYSQPYPQPYPYPYASPPPAPPPAPKPPSAVYGWDPDVPAPDGYKLVDSPNGTIIGSGVALLSIGWVSSVVAAAVGGAVEENDDPNNLDAIDPEDWAPLYIPVGGPIAAMFTLEPTAPGVGLLLADTLLQVGGIVGIIAGSLDKKHKIVRTDYGVQLELPSLGPGGVHVRGHF